MSLTPSTCEEAAHHRLRCERAGIPAQLYAPPRHSNLLLGGMRFHLVSWGEDDLPTILFLHGGNQTARTWDLICHELSASHRCLALDQRGHGDSEWSYAFDYGARAHARDITALVDHFGLERLVVVGMSMGCINALRYAIDHPERLAGLVAVDAGPWVRLDGAQGISDFVQDCAELPSLEDYVDRAMRFNPRRDPRLLRISLRHNLRRLPDGNLTWKSDQRRHRDMSSLEPMLDDLRDGIDRIRCPALVVRGAESEVFLDVDAERFAEALPRGRWTSVPGAGHTVQGDNPAALLEELRAFLREIGWGA